MSPKTKAAAITAAAVAAVVAIVVIVVLIDPLGGTPIIIKGSSEQFKNVEIGFDNAPAGSGTTLKVDGGFDTVKIIDATGGCVVYDFTGFGCWSNEIQMTTTSTSGGNSVNVDDTVFGDIETTFDISNFDGTPPTAPKYFKSRDYRAVTELLIVPNTVKPSCTDKNGKIDCPEKWPELKGLEIWIDHAGSTCAP